MNTTHTAPRRLIGLGVALAVSVPAAVALAAPASAAIPADTATMLQGMAVEEKLAHDVYVTLGETFDARQFDSIAAAETRHLGAVRTLMDRYGITDPTAGDAVGVFDDAATKALYADLVAEGTVSLTAAAQAGITIEKMDIADLDAAIAASPASDITMVLTALRRGSTNHLAAFTRLASGQVTTAMQNGTGSGMQAGRQGRTMGGAGSARGAGLQDGSCR